MKKQKIGKGDIVKNLKTGDIEILLDVQPAFDRYQVKGKSNWNYGIDKLQLLSADEVVAEIKTLYEHIEKIEDEKDMYANLFIEQQLKGESE